MAGFEELEICLFVKKLCCIKVCYACIIRQSSSLTVILGNGIIMQDVGIGV